MGSPPVAVDLPAELPDPVVTTLENGVRVATQVGGWESVFAPLVAPSM